MKVHRIILLVVDTDNLGADAVTDMIENAHYPNHAIGPQAMSTETVEVEWSDAHPLNRLKSQGAEFARLFPRKA